MAWLVSTGDGEAMTVAELIAKLQELPQDMKVYHGDEGYGPQPVDNVDIEQFSEYPYVDNYNEYKQFILLW